MASYIRLPQDFSVTAGATEKVFDPNSGIRTVDIQNLHATLALRLHFGNPWCLSFDGVNDVVACDGVAADIVSQTSGSLRTGILVTAAGSGSRTVFSIGDTNAETAFWIEVNTDNKVVASLVVAGTVQWTLRVDIALTDDKWYEITLVHDGVEPIIYVNGEGHGQTFTVSADKTAWLADLTGIDNANIGALDYNSAGNANWFQGKIDFLRLNSGKSSNSSLELACLYTMDEGTGNLTDASDNANTGTVSGATWATKSPGMQHGASIGRIYNVIDDPDIKRGCWATNAGGTDVDGVYKFGQAT